MLHTHLNDNFKRKIIIGRDILEKKKRKKIENEEKKEEIGRRGRGTR